METKFTVDINGNEIMFNSYEQAKNYIISYNKAQMQMYIVQSQAQIKLCEIQQRILEKQNLKNVRKQKLEKLNW
jgi:hypothetical protein